MLNIFGLFKCHSVDCSELSYRSVRKSLKTQYFNDIGFTLVELIVVVGILSVLAAMAIPTYKSYVLSTKNNSCANDIRTIEKAIIAYTVDNNGALPPDLNAVGMDKQLDPWKRPYHYARLSDAGAIPLLDSAGRELNRDFDLYSKGDDGVGSEQSKIIDPQNEDDIVRSNDGSFVGLRP